jgi:hypothetical protein
VEVEDTLTIVVMGVLAEAEAEVQLITHKTTD